ncbi:MAG: sigma-54 dependent transcriptional regulator [Pseudomonadota bacterium]
MEPSPKSNSLSKPGLIIVDDDPLIGESLQYFLSRDFAVEVASDRQEAIALLRRMLVPPALALVDLGLPPVTQLPNEGFKLIGELLAHAPQIKILVLTGQNEETNARRARALGALELVPKPCEPEYLRDLLHRALQLPDTRGFPAKNDKTPVILGESPPIQKLKQQIAQYAASSFPALVEGESGSGKEIIAAALHHLSPRSREPFLALNCAAISPALVEATLFGYVKGAFTGATATKAGYFEDAGTGTLFLDEIGELPIDFQAKLLRVLENGQFQRIGETHSRISQARIIAATNRDLRREVRNGQFRADLYHRLSVFTLAAPPLRDLGADRFLLLDYFRRFYATEGNTEAVDLTPEARGLWLAYDFPGNVRELKNIVIRLTTKYPGYTIGATELEMEFDLAPPSVDAQQALDARSPLEIARSELLHDRNFNLSEMLKSSEQAYIDAALDIAHGNVSQAAKLLGLNRTTLYSRMDALGKNERVKDE